MRKIPTLLMRDPDDRSRVLDQVAPGCQWVLAGQGTATRKYDGTCVMFDGTAWWARREVKPGKVAPPGYVPTGHDEATGKTMGWEPAASSAFAKTLTAALGGDPHAHAAGTYELVGPKVNGNPERLDSHHLIPHADAEVIPGQNVTIAGVKTLVAGVGQLGWEGIVWHHPDGRMCKLKARDLTARQEDR